MKTSIWKNWHGSFHFHCFSRAFCWLPPVVLGLASAFCETGAQSTIDDAPLPRYLHASRNCDHSYVLDLPGLPLMRMSHPLNSNPSPGHPMHISIRSFDEPNRATPLADLDTLHDPYRD